MSTVPRRFVLTLSCPDRVGIVHAVSGFLAERGCNILDSQQHGDVLAGRFFMRVHVDSASTGVGLDELRSQFEAVGRRYAMDWGIDDEEHRPGVLVMVSKLGHCLNDLLYRWRIGSLHGDIRAVVSNHPDFRDLVTSYGLPYHHIKVSARGKVDAEAALLRLVDTYDVELVVLARYMQVISAATCAALPRRMINIHHSFLPSFAGARPYQQAYEHGVKLVGATAHYVTAELDAGPIIEQEVVRVDHAHTPDRLAAVCHDLESLALARAVQWHLERRVLVNGNRTVIFR